ncbi:hypothetical protein [Spirosoma foliorum]|uniref:Outer membrane protein beta-barrel domain-containing protein n=1 Tax=Spirosoma foliorum TaxID=2710596 RepID=A0A7G5GNE1_9BACT|nr:hypothetical protein [Spirosoma foliorum]QMW00383.1 hypothetical protein H3H32_20465 [Spirosoma foliorum]
MHRYHLLLIGLLLRVSTTLAQPVVALNTRNNSDKPTRTAIAPRNTKASEAPFFLKMYGFYSLLTPGTEINYSSSQSQITAPTIYKPINTHLGAGPRAGIGAGLIVSDFINVGVDAEMLFGATLKTDYNVFVGSSSSTASFYAITSNTTLKVVSVIPNITFKALSRPSYYIYNRLGLVGGVVLDYKTVSNTLQTPPKGATTTSVNTTDYTKNSLALGYQAALGIQFRLGQAIRGFVEIVAYNQSFKPKELQGTTNSTTNGTTSVQSSSTVFKDLGDYNKENPYEQPSFNVAMNSVGVGAGLVFRF